MAFENFSGPYITGKVALVTGAGQGIGKATALLLAQAGAKLVIAEINPETGEQTAREIRDELKGEAIFVKTDVSQSTSLQSAVQTAVTIFGRLDVAVNNAGLLPDSAPIAEMDEAYWQRLISTNLCGVAWSLKWEVRQMIEQGAGGSIINLSSATISKPQEDMSAHIAAKHGIVGLTHTAARENGKHNIRVNALAAGPTATDLTVATLKAMGTTEEAEAKKVSFLGRLAQPVEIAHAVLWLASDSSSYVTGATVPVDSGMMLF
ncbi:uncharacterized protein N7484_003511 [Penicillium longicatenatum]|uniref:uncharacterized protein n=1 Tax=Penicillium longicatenatum TaxID=1561947 RepID=UPI0025490294|nr:uncharacterized protein N7484_003511 [Penicillium longicatenatum]KAJ5649788.1 hypothetical protein N7484_003511 [Penicillium longicatenatum]KAJ5672678.1 hypothetical protein N7507_001805 [Penicillium longicatenatum]